MYKKLSRNFKAQQSMKETCYLKTQSTHVSPLKMAELHVFRQCQWQNPCHVNHCSHVLSFIVTECSKKKP